LLFDAAFELARRYRALLDSPIADWRRRRRPQAEQSLTATDERAPAPIRRASTA
jgi:hypothetical protein